MNSIQDEVVSLDTNEFIFALRKDAIQPAKSFFSTSWTNLRFTCHCKFFSNYNIT